LQPGIIDSIRRNWYVAAALLLLFAVFVLRVSDTYSEFNGTYDEGLHISAGIEFYQDYRYTIHRQHPPLAPLALGLLPYLDGGRVEVGGGYFEPGRKLLERPEDYWRTLTLGRVGNLIFAPFLIGYVFVWAARLYGNVAGLAAVAAVTSSPNVLAHAGLATSDMAAATTLLAAAYHQSLWVTEPTRRHALWAGIAAGLAVGSKYSALGLLAPMLVIFVLWHHRQEWSLRGLSGLRAVLKPPAFFRRWALAAVLVLWACFGFQIDTLRDPEQRPHGTIDRLTTPGTTAHTAAYNLAEHVPVPMIAFWEGLYMLGYHSGVGHPSQFLLREVRRFDGWWYYFPVVLSTKSTLPLLLLFALAAVGWRFRSKASESGTAYLMICILIVLTMAMLSGINIGVRHVLVLYAFASIWIACLFSSDLRGRRGRILRGFALVGLTAHIGLSLQAHPDYLAYFNETVRGREHRVLSDSNLDWGQDLSRLARYLDENQIDKIHLAYFGMTSSEAVGIHGAEPLSPADRPQGWVAVSVTFLQGNYLPEEGPDYSWLQAHTPHAKIGKSIWLYHLEH
jgi:hypothetical protein